MSDTALGLPNERETLFVDPWSKKPNHQGMVPVDALFVGAWDNDLGIDNINEALFLGPVVVPNHSFRKNYQGELGRPRERRSRLDQVRNNLRLCRWRSARGHAEQSGDAASGRARACKGSLPVPTTAISARPPRER
jgi:hypothetical protein